MSKFYVVVCILISLFFCGCAGCRGNPSPLVGKWRTGKIMTDWGEAETIAVFTEDTVTMTLVPTRGDAMGETFKYKVRNGTIVSDSLNGGTPMPFSIRDNVLVTKDRASQETRFFRD